MNIQIPISTGELLDKLSILEIKKDKVKDSAKLKNINHEYDLLINLSKNLKDKDEKSFNSLYEEILKVNKKLWDIEDKIRILESEKKFDEEFISVARSVYFINDDRFDLKKKINETFGSDVAEEKEYIEYKQ
ncbi:MAG: hypothetical protein CBC28_01890 [Flavobacteriaceae bacterium TMED68]|nr:MAG: hypothetical protein CBC28_01890 [Flavobacteriaceae bacterium TMED68]|tara:strand:+ start:44790 stop:45185 length:396 start_codon:yes stop_codon:yes gene_type:complete